MNRDLRLRNTVGWAILTVALFVPFGASGQSTVTGVVTDAGGIGIPGVDIDIFDSIGQELDLTQDFTGPTGSFSLMTLDPIPVGLYDFVFKSPIGSRYFDQALDGVFLTAVTDIGTVMMESGWFVSGSVQNSSGIGLFEVNLDFLDATGTLVPVNGDVTTATGDYNVLVPPGTYDIEYDETALTAGGPFVPALLEGIAVFGDVALPDVILVNGYPLFGHVQDSAGSSIVGGDIDVRDPLTGDKIHTPGDDTDLLGNFNVLAPAGSWTVEVDPPAGLALVSQFIPTTVAASPLGTDMGTVVLPPGFFVTGTTRDQASSPVPNVDLDFVESSTGLEIPTANDNTDALGNFAAVVEAGTYDIQFRPLFATGLAPVALPATAVAGTTPLGDVTLPPGLVISGTVTASGVPVPGVEVVLFDSSTGDAVYVFGNDTDALGQYAFRQVAGTYDVSFIAPVGSGLTDQVVLGVVVSSDTVVDMDLDAVETTPPVEALTCTPIASDVELAWTLGAVDYDEIVVSRNGSPIATLPGSATQYVDTVSSDGVYGYAVVATRGGIAADPASCSVTVDTSPGDSDFIRGDVNQDTMVNIADAIAVLDFLFSATTTSLPCEDAGDANDSGAVDIADAVYVLSYLFTGGSDPLAPFPAAGPDPTPDSLICP